MGAGICGVCYWVMIMGCDLFIDILYLFYNLFIFVYNLFLVMICLYNTLIIKLFYYKTIFIGSIIKIALGKLYIPKTKNIIYL